MRVHFSSCAGASAVLLSSAAYAQSDARIIRPVAVAPATATRIGVIVPTVERPADLVQIRPAPVSPPALSRTIIVHSANPLGTIERMPVERELSLPEIRATRALQMGSSTIDLSAMLDNPDALPNVAARLETVPAVSVRAAAVTAYVVPQGLIVRSFLNYRIKPGSCSDASQRRQIEQAGVGCARRMSDEQRVADYSNPESERFVADPALRSQAIAKARRDWAAQDAEAQAQVANLRSILATPAERQKIEAELGAEATARLEQLDDTALAGEVVSAAETKIEDVMFIPKEDELDRTLGRVRADFQRELLIPKPSKIVTNQPIDKIVFLTGFTLGRQYEWSKRIEKTIKWCWVGCAVTYYAGARAGFSYGFGLRFPIVVDGNFRYEKDGSGERASLTANLTPVDGSPAQYSAAGLAGSQMFNAQEFVAELKGSAGYEYKLPLIGESSRGVSMGYDLASKLPAPYANGQFTPPMPGTTSGEIPFVFDSIDLLMGYGNWGAAGILVHPAVKVGLHSDSLRFTVHDHVASSDIELVNGAKVALAIDSATAQSRFSLRAPVYNLSFIATPGVEGRAFIDVGVWSNSWHFPVWFPQIAITLPPGGIDFACHAGTICNRDFVYAAGTPPPKLDGVVRPVQIEVNPHLNDRIKQ